MAERLTIIFDAQDKGLKKHIDALNKSHKKLTKAHSPLITQQKRLAKQSKRTSGGLLKLNHGARNTAGAFSVLRSQMLLASFGMALAIKPMLDLAKAFSDQNETLNKANVVFGDNISIVKQWADALGATVGRATSTIIEMASTLQDTFVPLGFARDVATQLSTSMTKLALDVASFNNKLDVDVMRDFQSAIVGNHETVRKYGIVITEASLKQEAYILGIHRGKGDLTDLAKVQARLSLIYKGSSDAIGDLNRTQKEYANQVKALKEKFKVLAEEMGANLVPVLSSIMSVFHNAGTVITYGFAITAVAVAYIAVAHAATAAAIAMRTVIKASRIGFLLIMIAAIAETIIAWFGFREHVEDAADSLNDAEAAMANATAGFSNLSEVIKEQEKAFKDEKEVLEDLIEISNRNLGVQLSQKEAMLESINVERNRIRLQIDFNEGQEKTIGLSQRQIDEQTRLQTAVATAGTAHSEAKQKMGQMDKVVKMLGSSIDFLADEYGVSDDAITAQKKAVLDSADAVKRAKEELANFNPVMETQIINTDELKEKLKLLGFSAEETKKEITKLRHAITGMSDEARELDEITTILTDIGEATGGVSFDMSGMITNFGETFSELKSLGMETAEATKAAYMEMAAAIGAAMVQAQMAASQARMDSIKKDAQADIAAFKKTERYNKLSTKQKKAFEAEKISVGNAAMKKEFEAQQKMQRAGVVMNTAAAIMQIWASPTMGVDPVTKGVLTAFVAALSLMQLEAINSQSAPTMAKGGMIGGKLHVQGGTMVNAERGEYIMSRAAVDAVGVETMNRINQGGGGAAINVSFTGNVMSDEFLELEAIPKIKEAIRRGADIGVS